MAQNEMERPAKSSQENGIYIVPAEGGEYTFECTNYSGVWLSLIEDNGEIVYPAADHEDFHSYMGKGFGVNCDHNHVKVSFAPLDASTESRSLTVDVTAGDIFYAFRFTQRR